MSDPGSFAAPELSFLVLPYEVRQQILCWALKEKGTVELQYPLWAGHDVYAQPLFSVCRTLRGEALQAFYETNHFLWIIDLSAQHRSDPADYHSMIAGDEATDADLEEDKERTTIPFRSALPWRYPHLRRHLRHLNVNIHLPPNWNAGAGAAQQWFTQFPRALERLVTALDYGHRLNKLHILFTAKHFDTRIALVGEQLHAIEILAKLRVRGHVKVQTRFPFREVFGDTRRSIEEVDLERRLRV